MMPFAPPEVSDGPRSPNPSFLQVRLGVSPVQPRAGTWKAHELVKQKTNELSSQERKATERDKPRTNLGPIPSTPGSAPAATGSLREETEVRPMLQPEPRPISVLPKGRIRKCTPRSSR